MCFFRALVSVLLISNVFAKDTGWSGNFSSEVLISMVKKEIIKDYKKACHVPKDMDFTPQINVVLAKGTHFETIDNLTFEVEINNDLNSETFSAFYVEAIKGKFAQTIELIYLEEPDFYCL